MKTTKLPSSEAELLDLADRRVAALATEVAWCCAFVDAITTHGEELLAKFCGASGWYGKAYDMWPELDSIVCMPFVSNSYKKRNMIISRCMKQSQAALAARGWSLTWIDWPKDEAEFRLAHHALDLDAARASLEAAIVTFGADILVNGSWIGETSLLVKALIEAGAELSAPRRNMKAIADDLIKSRDALAAQGWTLRWATRLSVSCFRLELTASRPA